MKFLLNWRQVIPTLVTLAAMMSGFFSILVTLESMGKPDPGQYHVWAAQFIMLAMLLDGLDGNLARWLRGTSEFGDELDTYVDLTAFGIAPALLIYTVSLQSSPAMRVLMTSAVVLSGVLRLSRFKVMDPHRGQHGYSGLPITVCAGWVALFVFISQSDPPVFRSIRSPGQEELWLTQGPMAGLFLLGILGFIFLQVSNVRYPKPSKKAIVYIFSVVLVALLFVPAFKLSMYSAAIMIVLGVSYIVLGPLYMKRVASRNEGRTDTDPAGTDGD